MNITNLTPVRMLLAQISRGLSAILEQLKEKGNVNATISGTVPVSIAATVPVSISSASVPIRVFESGLYDMAAAQNAAYLAWYNLYVRA